jgi:hypothetical protein
MPPADRLMPPSDRAVHAQMALAASSSASLRRATADPPWARALLIGI